MLGCLGADNLFHLFQKSKDGEEFCPKFYLTDYSLVPYLEAFSGGVLDFELKL